MMCCRNVNRDGGKNNSLKLINSIACHNIVGLISAMTNCVNCVQWRQNIRQDCGMLTRSSWVVWAKIRS